MPHRLRTARGAVPFPVLAFVAAVLVCGIEPHHARATSSDAALRLQVASTQDSAPLEGATIVVIDPQLSVFRREAKTDAAGRAEILDLAPREYYLRVEKETYRSHESTFTARSGEMTQRRVVLDRFGPAPDPDPPGEQVSLRAGRARPSRARAGADASSIRESPESLEGRSSAERKSVQRPGVVAVEPRSGLP